jgi:hypothetical protein
VTLQARKRKQRFLETEADLAEPMRTAGRCHYCAVPFESDETVVIVRGSERNHPFLIVPLEWVSVCVACAEPDELKAACYQTVCEGCGQPMLTPNWVPSFSSIFSASRPGSRVCSARCAQRYRRRQRESRDEVRCSVCNIGFRPRRADARFCSGACRQWAYRLRNHLTATTFATTAGVIVRDRAHFPADR